LITNELIADARNFVKSSIQVPQPNGLRPLKLSQEFIEWIEVKDISPAVILTSSLCHKLLIGLFLNPQLYSSVAINANAATATAIVSASQFQSICNIAKAGRRDLSYQEFMGFKMKESFATSLSTSLLEPNCSNCLSHELSLSMQLKQVNGS